MGNVVQIKTRCKNFSAQICILCSFSFLTYSILNCGKANKIPSAPLIKLQNKTVRTIKYDKTKTTIFCSKHSFLNIPDLFKLSVAELMYSILLLLLNELLKPLLGRTSSRGRFWAAAILLSHRPEPSGLAVHGEVDGLDIAGQHGRRFVLLRHTHRPL